MIIADIFEVRKTGSKIIIGFTNPDAEFPMQSGPEAYQQLVELVQQHECKVLVFDIRDIRMLPSSMLGLIASMSKHVEDLYLYNPTDDVREVVEVTKLDQLMELYDGDP